jgi:hypothetical protein
MRVFWSLAGRGLGCHRLLRRINRWSNRRLSEHRGNEHRRKLRWEQRLGRRVLYRRHDRNWRSVHRRFDGDRWCQREWR